jgi:DNA-binding GntR family transcriptional regulator
VRRALLQEWLAQAAGGILPRRPQRKLAPERLAAFLHGTQGRWFRLKELAAAFDLDRKTAWEYLHKLREAGLLVHNGERSAAVRFRLAERFLRVRLAALERRVARTLPARSRLQPEQVAEWLAATAGEAFWEDAWPERLSAGRRAEIIAALKNAEILELVWQSGRQQLLRLRRHWLQD